MSIQERNDEPNASENLMDLLSDKIGSTLKNSRDNFQKSVQSSQEKILSTVTTSREKLKQFSTEKIGFDIAHGNGLVILVATLSLIMAVLLGTILFRRGKKKEDPIDEPIFHPTEQLQATKKEKIRPQPPTPPPIEVLPLDIDAFVRKLRYSGFSVQRVKNGKVKDVTLRLSPHGELHWSNSFFKTKLPITTLVSAFKANDDVNDSTFLLEFKNKRVLHLRLESFEYPFDAKGVVKYFGAVIKKLVQNPRFVADILSDPALAKIKENDDDTMSVASVSTVQTPSVSPAFTRYGNRLNGLSTVPE